jgi:excisionase family DNA binding protein
MKATQSEPFLQSTASDLMTSPEAAIYLRISKGTLRHWVSDRKIEFVKMGRSVRFRKAHLERFISENVQENDPKGTHDGIS